MKYELVPCILVILFGFVACDINQDREKCANQLIGLATCLPYVSGQANAPPIDCCTGFKQVVAKSGECLCILVKDRNDPSLGLQINATRALSLPARCNLQDNRSITDCPAVLHLPPNSPDAKVFQDFVNSGKNATASAPAPAAAARGSSSRGRTMTTGGDQESDGGKARKRRQWIEMVQGILITMLVVHNNFSH